MHFWFEWKISLGADTNVDQSECGMIDADVTAAFCAIPAVADFAALESPEELRSFGKDYLLLFPQRERAHRRGGITPAVFAMAITNLHRITAHFDLHGPAVTLTLCVSTMLPLLPRGSLCGEQNQLIQNHVVESR